MLNLFKLYNKTDKEKSTSSSLENNKIFYKDFPSSVREWNNSIYTFNNNSLSLIPSTTITTLKLIKSYFNLYNFYLERRLRRIRLTRRLRLLSSHKIFVSNGEYKHTNNKVIITLYTFNRQKHNILSKIKKRYLNIFFKNKKIRRNLKKKFYRIKYKGLSLFKNANKNRLIVIKALAILDRIKKERTLDNYENLYSNFYLTKFYKNIVKKSLRKIKIYIIYKQMLYINKTKFNYTYLQILKNLLQKIYNKNVEFKLINLKYNYLNSDIFSESIVSKIVKNRKYLKRYLRKLIQKVKINKVSKYIRHEPKLNFTKLDYIKDPIEQLLVNKKISKKKKKKIALQYIKHKYISGVRLEVSGRLNRRYTASRSTRKVGYTGNLINVDSSYKGLSTVLLKGNLLSNLQYTKISSKTRVGAFGIKGWVSGN